jgi:hypothetical protein
MAVKKKAKNVRKAQTGSRAKRATKARKAQAGRKAKTAALSDEEMMAAWQRSMTPGEAHRRLAPLVGTWNAKSTFWMAPGAPPSTGDGVSEHRWVLGGRHVEQIYRGTTMGMPFEGIGYTGYDNTQKRYVGSWMDTMSTGIMTSVGTGKPTSSRVAFESRMFDCTSGAEVVFESFVHIRDQNHHSFEMWTRSPAGKRYRAMLVDYTRKA